MAPKRSRSQPGTGLGDHVRPLRPDELPSDWLPSALPSSAPATLEPSQAQEPEDTSTARPMAALTLVPTPVGNLEDLTPRARRLLSKAPVILCEDTRQTGQLLHLLGIERAGALERYHLANEHERLHGLIARMAAGTPMVLVSDAGTPAISDPGYLIVRAVLEAGLEVDCLPGPTALIPALVMSGLPCDRFVFEGFLPAQKGRATRLSGLVSEPRTIVLYESPHRIVKTLGELVAHFGADRPAALVREVSKRFQQVQRGTLIELATEADRTPPRGELVLIIGGAID